MSLFCSTYSGFTSAYPFVKDLILEKNKILTDYSKFRITMFILNEYKIGFTGLTSMYCGGQIKTIAEIDAYPFGFILELNPKEESMDLDITNFLGNSYDEKFDLEFGINIRERNIMIPSDFRTKNEIIECIEKNKKRSINN